MKKTLVVNCPSCSQHAIRIEYDYDVKAEYKLKTFLCPTCRASLEHWLKTKKEVDVSF
jgi:hypothetical protein